MNRVVPFGLALAASVALVEPLQAQSLNVDLGSAKGTPAATFGAAANQPGTWNNVGLGNTNLVGLTGLATTVSVSVSAQADSGAFGGCTGDTNALVGDNIFTSNGFSPLTWTVNFSGIQNGSYRVRLYGPDNTAVDTGNMVANGVNAASTTGDTCTLTSTDSSREIDVVVTSGALNIGGSFAGTQASVIGLAGVQITQLQQVPTMPVWTLLILAAMLVAYALVRLRRSPVAA